MKTTVSPVTARPSASLTVAVAVLSPLPSATTRFGARLTVTVPAVPIVWLSVAWPTTPELGVAVIVTSWGVVEAVIVAV